MLKLKLEARRTWDRPCSARRVHVDRHVGGPVLQADEVNGVELRRMVSVSRHTGCRNSRLPVPLAGAAQAAPAEAKSAC